MTRARPPFLEGVALAAIASLLGGALYRLLGLALSEPAAVAAALSAIGLGYLAYLIRRAGEPVGRVTAVLAWLLVSGAALLLAPGLLLPLQIGLIWLVRAAYLQPSLLAAAADLGLIVLGLGAALWAFAATASLAAALWSFFLCQALFSAVPRRLPSPQSADPFAQAERSARDCLRRLARNP